MSIARVYTVGSARQRYSKSTSGRSIVVKRKDGTPKLGRGGQPMIRHLTTPNHDQPLPNYKCGKCGAEIQVGSPYRYWEPYFRSSAKAIRCMKSTCSPKMSELESSNLSEAYAAQETALADLDGLSGDPGETSDVTSIVETFGEALTDLAAQYREADEQFGGGGSTQSGETADALETSADELSSWSPSEDSFDEDTVQWCELHTDEAWADSQDMGDDGEAGQAKSVDPAREACDDCISVLAEAKQSWWDEVINEAQDAIDGAQFS